MKTVNAIKKLERNGFEVRHNDNSQWWADKDGERISWIDQKGVVHALCSKRVAERDDPQSDYFAGVYPSSLKSAIEMADNAIARRREEAPMIAEKQRAAEDARRIQNEKLEEATGAKRPSVNLKSLGGVRFDVISVIRRILEDAGQRTRAIEFSNLAFATVSWAAMVAVCREYVELN